MQPGFEAVPAGGPLGRLDRARREGVAATRRDADYTLVPTTCFNCESACGLLAYVDKETGEIRKFEGNPAHPGSRGRNCAKGPATINQIDDPERILYPLSAGSGRAAAGGWERCTWDEALDDLAGRIRAALVRDEPNEVMYHVGRPGEDGFTERVLAAWGVDGHNSHTNICSSGGRVGYAFWMGFDRPSPDYANAKVIFLISAHLESGHYFNPHAQRIIEGKQRGAKLIVVDPRLSNTASQADHWLPAWPGTEPALLLAIARQLISSDRFDRDFVRRWVNWADYLRGGARRTSRVDVRELRRRAQAALRATTPPSTPRPRRASPRRRSRDGRRRDRPGRRRARRAQLARVGGRRARRLADRPLPVLPQRPDRLGRDARRHLAERLGQVGAPPAVHAAPPQAVERADLAARVPAGVLRDVVPAAALPARGPGQRSTSTSPASTTRSGPTRTG